jgi:hypothetical protein
MTDSGAAKLINNENELYNQLRKYLGNISTTTETKLRNVGNYLVSSGFRTGRINHKCAILLRNQI